MRQISFGDKVRILSTPAWLTAYLLGCLRARVGYSTVRDILIASPEFLAESHAGVAMHSIAGEDAFGDLARLLVESDMLPAHEVAVAGMYKPLGNLLQRQITASY